MRGNTVAVPSVDAIATRFGSDDSALCDVAVAAVGVDVRRLLEDGRGGGFAAAAAPSESAAAISPVAGDSANRPRR